MTAAKKVTGRGRRQQTGGSKHVGVRVLRIFAAAFVLFVAFLLNTWDVVSPSFLSDRQAIFEQEKSSRFENWLTPWLIRIKSHRDQPSPRVTTIAFDSGNLDYLRGNACKGREFLADLLDELGRLNVQLIVVDKYYPPKSCSDGSSNERFLQGLAGSRSKIVAALHTEGESYENGAWTLIDDGAFSFLPTNVVPGVIRFDQDDRRIPLQWPIQSAGLGGEPKSRLVDTLSLAAAKIADPTLVEHHGLAWFLAARRNPAMEYTAVRLNPVTAQQVLCSDASLREVAMKWQTDCASIANVSLTSIVVVGDESEQDEWPLADRSLYGYQIHAMYIESLLDGQYFREVPLSVWYPLLAIWAVVTQTWLAFSDRPWSVIARTCGMTLALVALYTLVLVMLDFYPPVTATICLLINLFIMALLEFAEFLATERMERRKAT